MESATDLDLGWSFRSLVVLAGVCGLPESKGPFVFMALSSLTPQHVLSYSKSDLTRV